MARVVILLGVLGLMAAMLCGCQSASVPTETPIAATQTPWIVAVTATPCPTQPRETPPTQTPWVIVVTATPTLERSTPTGTAIPATETRQAVGATPQPGTATATPTQRPASRPSPTPSPTYTAVPYAYRLPQLLEPPVGVAMSWKSSVLLEWSPVGDLADDEYYALHLDAFRESDGSFWYGDYVFTKDTSYRLEGAFLAPFHPPESQGRGLVYWWVAVVHKTGETADGKPLGVEISPQSDKRFFIAEPKP